MGCAAGKPTIDEQTPTKELQKSAIPQNVRKVDVLPIAVDDTITISARTSQGLAFEVQLDEGESNMIKKHPPKRLQRLEDQQMPSLTHRLLDDKQVEAEMRRQQANGLLIERMHQEPTTVAL